LIFAFLIGRILMNNPALLELYKELVINRVITADEFWATHAPQFLSVVKGKGSSSAGPAEPPPPDQQPTGVSGAFLVCVLIAIDYGHEDGRNVNDLRGDLGANWYPLTYFRKILRLPFQSLGLIQEIT
jgi:hypothetical protein